MAGGPQIFAPIARYARNSFGILSFASVGGYQRHRESGLRSGTQIGFHQVFPHSLVHCRTVGRILRGQGRTADQIPATVAHRVLGDSTPQKVKNIRRSMVAVYTGSSQLDH